MDLFSPVFGNLYPWGLGYLRAYMLAPNDAAKRQLINLNNATHMLEQIEKVALLPQPDGLKADCWGTASALVGSAIWDREFQPNGGFSGAREIGSVPELDALPMAEWRTVAFMLGLMRAIDAHHPDVRGGASVKKAKEVAVAHHAEFNLLANEKYCQNAWNKYQSVAHLCAAAFEPAFQGSSAAGESSLLLMLAIARDYQQFLTSFRPHGRAAALVPKSVAWLVPDNLNLPPVPTGITAPLTGSILLKVKEYRAPK